jgi:nucleotide-binding universal stress UspA family protein
MAKRKYSTIMLLAETTEEGMKAARDAIHLAAEEGAALVIASVVDTSVLKRLLASRIFVREEMEEFEREFEESCQRQMRYLSELAGKAGIEYHTVLLKGACHVEILREQSKHGADLLVMGAFRASTAGRDLVAKEKQLIIDEVPCPVLLVR